MSTDDSTTKTCKCGCGTPVNRTWVTGHNKRRTYCKKGLHELTPENVFVSRATGKRSCKWCTLARQRERRRENPQLAASVQILGRYGLTLDDRRAMLEAQGNACAICRKPLGVHGKDTLVDHCHNSSVVRGLLCRKCNTGLGMFNDSVETLERAARYLEHYSGEDKAIRGSSP